MSNLSPTEELARELREAFENDTETPEEHFDRLVEEGIIDRNGRVICQKLFGTGAGQQTSPVAEKNGE